MKDLWLDWLQEKQRNFFYGVAAVVVLFFVAFQLFEKFHTSEPRNYLSTNLAFEKWLLHDKDFNEVEEALKSNPDLESKFGALIANKFIVRNEGNRAQPFAEEVFDRVLQKIPEHTEFAKGSLLISKGSLKEALNHSISLHHRLKKDSVLYGFNLFRISSLYRALGDRPSEVISLGQLEHFMETNMKASTILTECFSEGEATLLNYIAQRKSKTSAE